MTDAQINIFINLINQAGTLSNLLQNKIEEIELMLTSIFPEFEFNIDFITLSSILPYKLYILSIISYKHWQSSRYPDTRPISAKDYNKNLPLVKSLPKIHDITTRTLKNLKTFLNYIVT